MQPQQTFGAPKQPVRPVAPNPFLTPRPVVPAASAMPAMQAAPVRPAQAGPMVGNPVVGNPVNTAAGAAAAGGAMNGASVTGATGAENPFVDELIVADAKTKTEDSEVGFGETDSVIEDGTKKPKNNKIMLYAAIGCGVLAVAGVVFGVIGMMKKPETKVETVVETVVDDVAAANILTPYLKQISYANTILDSGLMDITKFELAYRNLPATDIFYKSDGYVAVSYDAMNYVYKTLFGGDLAKSSYGGDELFSLAEYISDDGGERFVIAPDNFSGAGLVSVTRVKEASVLGDSLTVTVYHGNVSVCGYGDAVGYCLGPDNIDDMAVDQFVKENADSMPTVDLVFSAADGRYILTRVTQNASPENNANGADDDVTDDMDDNTADDANDSATDEDILIEIDDVTDDTGEGEEEVAE